jgi:hypothetical protein
VVLAGEFHHGHERRSGNLTADRGQAHARERTKARETARSDFRGRSLWTRTSC